MPRNTIQLAFDLYKAKCTESCFMLSADLGLFMEHLERFIAHCVRQRVTGVDEDFDDFVNECLLKVWELAGRRSFPFDRIERFVEGIKVVCQNRCIDLLRTRDAQERLTARLQIVLTPAPAPMTPADLCWTRELAGSSVAVITQGMLARSRFPAISEDVCRDVAQNFVDERPEHKIRGIIKGARLFRFDFMLKYTIFLYRWTFYDLSREVLHLLEKVRPTG